ncbi:MAG TPA: YggT family protein [Desulfobacterales bacterium]|nr:YggT family protein [Desulfobacterales bacterium]
MIAIYRTISLIFWVLDLAIIARVLISWIRADPLNPIVRFVYDVTEPILGPIRRALPAMGGIDFSPLVAVILLDLLERLIIRLIF